MGGRGPAGAGAGSGQSADLTGSAASAGIPAGASGDASASAALSPGLGPQLSQLKGPVSHPQRSVSQQCLPMSHEHSGMSQQNRAVSQAFVPVSQVKPALSHANHPVSRADHLLLHGHSARVFAVIRDYRKCPRPEMMTCHGLFPVWYGSITGSGMVRSVPVVSPYRTGGEPVENPLPTSGGMPPLTDAAGGVATSSLRSDLRAPQALSHRWPDRPWHPSRSPPVPWPVPRAPAGPAPQVPVAPEPFAVCVSSPDPVTASDCRLPERL